VDIKLENLKKYLEEVYGTNVDIINLHGVKVEKGEIKGYGYGIPLIVEYKVNGMIKKAVIETVKEDIFGHEYLSDRVANIVLAYKTYNRLHKHAKAISIGYFDDKNEILMIKDFKEFFILVEFIEGRLYYKDLEEIKEREQIIEKDVERCLKLCNYLSQIHSLKSKDKRLYIRRIRDLIGHGECIFGLIDSYSKDFKFFSEDDFIKLEKKLIEWRWKLKNYTHRLSVIHGDFHPWNIFFLDNNDFILNDRSRGEYGDPADDVSALTINYLFFSLQKYRKLYGSFERLWEIFYENYVKFTEDEEIFKVIQPFLIWRSLVIANPIWYPNLDDEVREKIFNFIRNLAENDFFDYKRVNDLLNV
jgi:Predicted aminoglycoside phosphotransferase